MAKVNPKEAQSLSKLFAQMRNDSASAQANFEAMLATSDKGLRKFQGQLRKLAKSNVKEMRKKQAEIDKLNNKLTRLTKTEERRKKVLSDEVKEMQSANQAIHKLTETTKEAGVQTRKLTDLFSRQINFIRQYASAAGLLVGVIEGITALYRNWADQQTRLTRGMGEASQALGMTARQFSEFQGRADALRETFAGLEGDVDGWAMSLQHTQEVMLSLRRNAQSLGDGVEEAMLRTARGFGIGNDQAGQLFRFLETGVAGAGTSLDEFGADMISFAESIGGNASQMTSDFMGAQDAIAQFGSEGIQVFHDAAMMANEFGFETNRIFQMMRGFDTFSQASQNVNQLNAMLGTSLSSYELMLEQNPAERLEMIRQQLLSSGQTWNEMTRQQRQALAQITGEGESTLARVFGEGLSLDQIRADAERQANEQAARERRAQDAQEVMNNLLMRSSEVWDSIQRIFGGIVVDITRALTPAFKIFHQEVSGLATEFREWLNDVMESGEAETFIRDISNWIRDAASWLRSVDWRGIWASTARTWREWQPTVETIGSAIMGILEFAAEHPGIIAGLFAGAAIARFAGMLSQIPGAVSMLSGAGAGGGVPAVAGAVAPAAAVAASYGIAVESDRIGAQEGRRSRTDLLTQRRLGISALEELERRGSMERGEARQGREASAIAETRSALANIATEHLGFRSTRGMRNLGFRTRQELDQTRNPIEDVINDAIRGNRGMNSGRLARIIYQRLGNNRSLADEAVGGDLESYIREQRQTMGPASRAGAGSATENSGATGRTANATPTSRALDTDGTVNVRVLLDGREVGRSHVERAQGNRSPGV